MHTLILEDEATAKRCSGCEQEKPLNAFSPMAHGLYGRHPRCKGCRNNDAQRKRFEDRTVPVDRRYKHAPQPFVQNADGSFKRVPPQAPPSRVCSLASAQRQFISRAVGARVTGNLSPIVKVTS